MAEAQERSPFNIVIREVVNKFLSRRVANPSSITDVVVQKREQTSAALEDETLFDDSEPEDATPSAEEATDNLIVHVGGHDECVANTNHDDDDDDAIFNGIETQAVVANNVKRVLQDRLDAPRPVTDERTEPTLERAFATAAETSTRVSYEAPEAVGKKLEGGSTPPTPSPLAEKVATGFQTGRGDSVEVSLKALAASKNVFDQEDQLSGSSLMPLVPSAGFTTARGTAQKVSEKALKKIREMFQEELPDVSRVHTGAITPEGDTKAPEEPALTEKVDKRSGLSNTSVSEGPSSGFTTARGTAQKVSEAALREVRKMFEEEVAVVAGGDAETKGSGTVEKARRTSDFTRGPVEPLPGCSAVNLEAGALPEFSTARGVPQKISEKALKQVRKMFDEEIPGVTWVDNQDNGPGKTSKTFVMSGFATGRGESVPVLKENVDLAKKILEEADLDCEGSKLPASKRTPSEQCAPTAVRTRSQDLLKENARGSKTPARRFAGLKRRSPMCITPLNRLSSPITPLRTPSGEPTLTPLRSHKQEKPPVKKSRVLVDIKENENGDETANKVKLSALTLLDQPPATADSTWFQDDVSGRRVHLDDVKRSFRREINVRSSNFDSWFANHFEQIVWKLANYSGRVKELKGCLITENVLDQLKHRWKIEHDGKRSPLRMIVERDAPAEATMVLLVKDVQPSHVILTDGWYSLPCDVDAPLQALIAKGSIRPGLKLCVCGTQLKGATNGVDPLEPMDARLSIRYNSTRRARCYAKIGYVRQSLLLPLSAVVLDGGTLPTIRVRVTSSSPLMFFEKFAQGGSIMRQEGSELKEQKKFNEKMSSLLEKIHEEVVKELELEQKSIRVTRTRSRHLPPVASLKSGEEILNALESSLDPSQLMQNLSSSQRRTLENYQAETKEKLRLRVENETRRRLEDMKQRRECPEERIVAPILKLMVCCCLSNIEVPLTVWRPSEDLRAMLRVGATVTIFRANVTSCRKSPFSLTTNNKTSFEIYEENSDHQSSPKRARRE